MNKLNPEHIDGFLEEIFNENKYNFKDFDDFTFAFEVKCTCSSREFYVYKDTKPTVVAKCVHCSKEIELYNLKYYTSASVIKAERLLEKYISKSNDRIFNLCIVYQYSDEFEISDPNFDRNDITWCVIYAYGINSGKVSEIINDETA